MLIFDAHLDLSMNALDWNRDLRQPLEKIKAAEAHLTDQPDRGRGVVSFDEMRKGEIKLCVATLIARYAFEGHPLNGWRSPEQAYAQVHGQRAWYHAMEAAGEISILKSKDDLEGHLGQNDDSKIGCFISLEGADSVLNMDVLQEYFDFGVRMIGPAHYGPGVYAHGTDSDAPLNAQGIELLKHMGGLGMILDATHLCDSAFETALDTYQGPVWASHHLTRYITPHNRQLSDEMIGRLLERNAIIGMAMDAWMIVPNWKRGINSPQNTVVTLDQVADHLDHICQLAGNSRHVCIGSDLDGGFGTEQCPSDIKSIADLQKIAAVLEKRGYTNADIEGIMWRNGVDFLRRNIA